MTTGADIIATARTVLGDEYQWGGEDNPGFDCSGLCQWCYAQRGIAIPRTSQEQAQGGAAAAYNDLQLGDVIIFYPGATHCALYSGNGNIIQASQPGVPVEEVPIEQGGTYLTARRYLTMQEPTTMTLFGPDLSNNNWSSSAEITGWLDDCFHREGYSWLEHKVSEGNYYQDPYWVAVRDWCASNDIPAIGYHYVTTNDADSQAQTFVGNGGGNVAMLDFEANSGDINNFWSVVNAFNAAGVQIVLSYIPHWYWQQIGSPDLSGVPGLISSSYFERGTFGSVEYNDAGGDAGPGWSSYGGATPAMWQFTDGALIDGKFVDANAFKGTLDQLKQLLGAAPVPQPDGPVYATGSKPTDQATQISQIYDQLLIVWPQLGNRTPVDALAAIIQNLGIEASA